MKNYSRKFFFICLGLFIAGQCTIAKSVKVKNNIDWPSFMQCQDMIWETLPEYWYESAFMGNGMLGLMIYKEPNENYIRLETGRRRSSSGTWLSPYSPFTHRTFRSPSTR